MTPSPLLRFYLVPRKGLEPPLSLEKRILSPPRLPFRHLGQPGQVNYSQPARINCSIEGWHRREDGVTPYRADRKAAVNSTAALTFIPS